MPIDVHVRSTCAESLLLLNVAIEPRKITDLQSCNFIRRYKLIVVAAATLTLPLPREDTYLLSKKPVIGFHGTVNAETRMERNDQSKRCCSITFNCEVACLSMFAV